MVHPPGTCFHTVIDEMLYQTSDPLKRSLMPRCPPAKALAAECESRLPLFATSAIVAISITCPTCILVAV